MSAPCEIEQSPPYVRTLARSVCAIVFREAVLREGDTYRLLLDQGRLPIRGTGFLVAPNVVATALHVVGNSADAYALVFDFVSREGNAPSHIAAGHVRASLTLNANVRDIAPGYVFLCFDDPIIERAPLALSPRFVARNEHVFAIGHPAGTTMKYFPAARVVASDNNRPVFTASDVGTTCGNSGSPFFSSDVHEGNHGVVGAVIASITRGRSDTRGYSQVTAVRTTRLANAVGALDSATCRMRAAHN
ncbi:MAG TPA: serine protease [Candidatus Krumholzibacteria bacterium]|nr:serine protease [Candidatus Krumholzibacteria bacterium]